jgi:phenylacetate-CoA ligase
MPASNILRRVIPTRLKNPIRNYLYPIIPLKIRLSKDYFKIKSFLNEAQWWNQKQIERWQFNRLREIISYAYKNIPGYYQLFRDANIKPDDVRSLADICLLPFTTKELFRDNLNDFTSPKLKATDKIYLTTGGSTGIPFGFYTTQFENRMELAFMHNSWERMRWKIGEKSAVLRGAFIGTEDKIWYLDKANNELLLSTYYLTEETYPKFLDVLQKHKPKYLQAYPSAAIILADLLINNGDIGKIGFEIILLGSENIYEWQKKKIQNAFPMACIFGWYGHAEKAVLAPWCEKTDSYHVWPFYGYTELINEKGEDVEENQIGEIIGTSFWCKATPFIRYRTMDFARNGPSECPYCGRQFRIFLIT